MVMDEGLTQEVGDVGTINYPDVGFGTTLIRVMTIKPNNDGWELQCVKEDPAVYSTSVQAGPSIPNTSLPNPLNIPAPTNLAWGEELYVLPTGVVSSRMRATWDDMRNAFPSLSGYGVTVYNGTQLLETAVVQTPSYAYLAPQAGVSYTINVQTVMSAFSSGATSAVASCLGKLLKPGDVPYLFIYETAGILNFSWIPAVDLDVTAHEIRYGPVGSATWDTATTLERVPFPARTYVTHTVVPGNYRFFIKALDSIRNSTYPNGQESINAKTFDINVGGDPNLFNAGSYAYTTPTLVNMAASRELNTTTWRSEYGTSWNAAFPLPMSANYTNPLSQYSGTGVSSLTTEAFDLGIQYSGTFVASMDYVDIIGVASFYIEVSNDNFVADTRQFVGQSATATARYVRLRVQTSGEMLVRSLGVVNVSVIALSENFDVMTSASGPVTVTLSRAYTRVKTIQLTADVSAGQRNPGFLNVLLTGSPRFDESGMDTPDTYNDNVTIPANTLDVECWDGLNVMVACPVKGVFTGI
jgi:hypothetical protein